MNRTRKKLYLMRFNVLPKDLPCSCMGTNTVPVISIIDIDYALTTPHSGDITAILHTTLYIQIITIQARSIPPVGPLMGIGHMTATITGMYFPQTWQDRINHRGLLLALRRKKQKLIW